MCGSIFFGFSSGSLFIVELYKVTLPLSLFVNIVEDVLFEATLLELSLDKTDQGCNQPLFSLLIELLIIFPN